MIQFHVIVDENSESNENSSSENSFSSINPTIDVSTTNSYNSPELLQQEILRRFDSSESGDGLMADKPKRGVLLLMSGCSDLGVLSVSCWVNWE